MTKNTFKAIFKNGLLKPLTKIDLTDEEEVVLKIVGHKSVVLETQGMIRGNRRYLHEIAQSKEFSVWNF